MWNGTSVVCDPLTGQRGRQEWSGGVRGGEDRGQGRGGWRGHEGSGGGGLVLLGCPPSPVFVPAVSGRHALPITHCRQQWLPSFPAFPERTRSLSKDPPAGRTLTRLICSSHSAQRSNLTGLFITQQISRQWRVTKNNRWQNIHSQTNRTKSCDLKCWSTNVWT